MHFEEQYPNKPPSVKFISTMFHPNVYATGELCLDILQNRWSPTYDVAAVLTSIQRYAKKRQRWSFAESVSLTRCKLTDTYSFKVYSTIPTPAHLPTSKPPICTRTTGKSTPSVCARQWRKVGKTEGQTNGRGGQDESYSKLWGHLALLAWAFAFNNPL